MTQSWRGGYVADIAYIEGFYVQQSPARMALACLFGNVAAELPQPNDDATYLELGCGVGIGCPRNGGLQSRLAGDSHRLQPGTYRYCRWTRSRRAPRQHPLRGGRSRAAHDELSSGRHPAGRLRDHARAVGRGSATRSAPVSCACWQPRRGLAA